MHRCVQYGSLFVLRRGRWRLQYRQYSLAQFDFGFFYFSEGIISHFFIKVTEIQLEGGGQNGLCTASASFTLVFHSFRRHYAAPMRMGLDLTSLSILSISSISISVSVDQFESHDQDVLSSLSLDM